MARLTRQANQAHIDIIANIIWPALVNRQRVFSLRARISAKSVAAWPIGFAQFSLKFDTTGQITGRLPSSTELITARAEDTAAGFLV
jgi:hypothetical protein